MQIYIYSFINHYRNSFYLYSLTIFSYIAITNKKTIVTESLGRHGSTDIGAAHEQECGYIRIHLPT